MSDDRLNDEYERLSQEARMICYGEILDSMIGNLGSIAVEVVQNYSVIENEMRRAGMEIAPPSMEHLVVQTWRIWPYAIQKGSVLGFTPIADMVDRLRSAGHSPSFIISVETMRDGFEWLFILDMIAHDEPSAVALRMAIETIS